MPFFELFMSAPKDELHQWYASALDILCITVYILGITVYMQVYGAKVLLYPGISAYLETTLCLLCYFVTLRSCGALIFSTVKGSPWYPPLGLRQCGKDCRIALPLWWQTPR